VARLYSDPEFRKGLASTFGNVRSLRLSLAPPLFAAIDPVTGAPLKRSYGAWMLGAMSVLARLKGLRGTPFDPFGATAERRLERELRDEFLRVIDLICEALPTADPDALLELARLPAMVRGYGHVKTTAAKRYRVRLAELTARLAERSASDRDGRRKPPRPLAAAKVAQA
jgi:indolepyruvate ferredoxin oxidoreductase